MNFFEQQPSKQWSALTFRGETIAEVWFKPEGEPLGLVFRVPRDSFQIPDAGQRLSPAALLKGVAVAPAEVESWHLGNGSNLSMTGLMIPLTPPDDGPMELHVRLKPPATAPVPDAEAAEPGSVAWADLEIQWKTVLGLEATIDTMRLSMEVLRAELGAASRQSLAADEKVNALSADLANWSKAKNRAHYSLPKANEFIHRATWVAGTPERKRLGEFFKNLSDAPADLPPATQTLQQIEFLRKDCQVLAAHGTAVFQECKGVLADIQRALRALQSNAATRASQKQGRIVGKGKSY